MRFYLIPISTRRTLLYCQRLDTAAADSKSLFDKAQDKVAKTWADWEKREKGWQKKIVDYGNQAFRRIPYEEWGLKSIPPRSQRLKQKGRKSKYVEVVYPESLLAADKVSRVVQTLATERQALHQTRLRWCLVGMPLTAPIGILPVIPNLPFFYLAFRAWSHWRALAGGKHTQFLVRNHLLIMRPCPVVDQAYTNQPSRVASTSKATADGGTGEDKVPESSSSALSGTVDEETILLNQEKATEMCQALKLPQLEVELERAIWQVETAIEKRKAGLPKQTGTAAVESEAKSSAAAESEAKRSAAASSANEKPL